MRKLWSLFALLALLVMASRVGAQTTTTSTVTTTTTITTTTLPGLTLHVITNDDCTGNGTATIGSSSFTNVACCKANNAGSCNDRMNFGSYFEYALTLGADGTTNQYVSGGTQLLKAEAGRVGLDQNAWVHAYCNVSALGHGTLIVPATATPLLAPVKVKLFAGATELAGATVVTTADSITCLVFGR